MALRSMQVQFLQRFVAQRAARTPEQIKYDDQYNNGFPLENRLHGGCRISSLNHVVGLIFRHNALLCNDLRSLFHAIQG